jgi:hypothetical protein
VGGRKGTCREPVLPSQMVVSVVLYLLTHSLTHTLCRALLLLCSHFHVC